MIYIVELINPRAELGHEDEDVEMGTVTMEYIRSPYEEGQPRYYEQVPWLASHTGIFHQLQTVSRYPSYKLEDAWLSTILHPGPSKDSSRRYDGVNVYQDGITLWLYPSSFPNCWDRFFVLSISMMLAWSAVESAFAGSNRKGVVGNLE